MDLFSRQGDRILRRQAPLARRMRPATLDEFVGQEHILGRGKLLRRAIEGDRLSSVVFYGPPGTGKTALANIIAGITQSHFQSLNAVTSGIADIRRVMEDASDRLGLHETRTILFIDEVHRFNKTQQDALLPGEVTATRCYYGTYFATGFNSATENAKTAILHSIAYVNDLHAEPYVRLI
jgi:putative ATPase